MDQSESFIRRAERSRPSGCTTPKWRMWKSGLSSKIRKKKSKFLRLSFRQRRMVPSRSGTREEEHSTATDTDLRWSHTHTHSLSVYHTYTHTLTIILSHSHIFTLSRISLSANLFVTACSSQALTYSSKASGFVSFDTSFCLALLECEMIKGGLLAIYIFSLISNSYFSK